MTRKWHNRDSGSDLPEPKVCVPKNYDVIFSDTTSKTSSTSSSPSSASFPSLLLPSPPPLPPPTSFFYLYMPFMFTCKVLGRGLKGQWLLLSQFLLTDNRHFHLFHSFIHSLQNANHRTTETNKLQSLLWNTAGMPKAFLPYIHMKAGQAPPSSSVSFLCLMGSST